MKVIGFGDSILKGAVLTDGPTLKYSLLQAGFLEQVCSAKGLDLVNHARFGSTISVGRSVFDRFVHNIENGDIVLFEFGGNDCDFPWEHTLILACLSIVISIIQTAFIVFRGNKKDE